MAATLGASDLSGQALLGKSAIVEAGQRINHRKVAEDTVMVLFFEELSTQTFDENFLVDRVDIEKYDQSDQTKDSFGQLHFEDGFRVGQNRRERERDYCKGQKQNDKDGITAHPPVAFFDASALLCEFLSAKFDGRGQSVELSCVLHCVSRAEWPNSSIQLRAAVSGGQCGFQATAHGSYCPSAERTPPPG